jgi:hypothetical protein
MSGPVTAIVDVAVSAVVFGLSHAYQGRAGALSTTLVGGVRRTPGRDGR